MIHDYDFTESGLAPDSLTTKEFEAMLVAWSRTPDVRPILLSAFLDSAVWPATIDSRRMRHYNGKLFAVAWPFGCFATPGTCIGIRELPGR